MLQLYYASLYLAVNEKIVGRLAGGIVKIRDDREDCVEVLLDHVSWKELYEEVASGKLSRNMYVGETFWKKRPYVSADCYGEYFPKYFEDTATKFTVTWSYKLDPHYTVNDVLKYAKADQAVQWFKERGLSVCPLQ